jgi:[citrate (pro-3S)-lyase] ligase
MAGNPKQREFFSNRVPLIFAAGYSFSRYFADRGIGSLSVYCERADYSFGRQICFDLSMSFDVDVKFWLSDAMYPAGFPNQNLTASPNFNPAHIAQLTENDDVLILCCEPDNECLNQIHQRTKRTYPISEIWADVWWRAYMANCGGKYVNIANGHRVVPGQPDGAERTIYVFGGCITFGAGCPDDGTSSAHLQKLLIRHGAANIRVENYGMFIFARGKYVFETMKSIPFKPGDVLISSFAGISAPKGITHLPDGVFSIDTCGLFERPHDWGENVFLDTSHPNQHGQFALAKTLFDFLESKGFFEDFAANTKMSSNEKAPPMSHSDANELNAYLARLSPLRLPVGAIVMNCNPFTLGHRRLAEYAASKVARLYVFVVEEDKSFFPFADRFELVKQGTRDIDNVTVLPSGRFIISSLTFTDYFGKAELQDRVVDPSMDAELFARRIAPALGVTVRFAGEEPLDNVTRQYNDALARILPEYGVDFQVIPRAESDGEPISASRVRALFAERAFGEISKLVPGTTLKYLQSLPPPPAMIASF